LASFGVPVACFFNHLDARRRLLFYHLLNNPG
jgi:hypothetical protein